MICLAAHCLLCLERYGRQVLAVVPLIDHLMGNDRMVVSPDGDLDIAADGGGALARRLADPLPADAAVLAGDLSSS